MNDFVLITGATGGLGRAFAVECAERGWNLFLTDRSPEPLQSLATALINTYGIEVSYETCDLTDGSSRNDFFESLRGKSERFRMLINIAGVDYEGPFLDKTREEIRSIIRVNIEATLEITHAILEIQGPHSPIRIINVSSLASFYPMPIKATYAASKRFLLDFSLALREEIRANGSTVTVLCPAGLPTTAGAIRGIDAQGLMGRLTTKNVGFVAARTINYALKGRPVYIPGLFNRILQRAGSLFPALFITRLLGKRWNEAYQKSSSLSRG